MNREKKTPGPMGRPPIDPELRRVTLSVRIPKPTRRRLRQIAKALGTTVSTVVEILVDRVPKKDGG